MRKWHCFIFIVLTFGIFQFASSQDKSYVINGRVTDMNSDALAGAGITIDKRVTGVHSDEDGKYSLTGLKQGVYKIRFSFIGYESEFREIELKSDTVLNIALPPKLFLTEEVLITASRAGDNSPLAFTTLGKDILKRSNTGNDMPYLLSLTPSLVETSEAGNGIGYTNLRIRGTDGNRINVTIDGIPLNDPESQQVFWVDIPDLASSVENIQVQRGAGTSTNGAGAFGATISIQTSIPENEPFAEVSSSIGSFNTFKNMLSAGTGLLNEKFAFQMRYSDLKSDGYIYRTGSNHRSAFINGVYRTERSSLKANIILGEEHTGIGWWGVPNEMLSVDRRYNPAGEYTDEAGDKHYYDNETDNYVQNHFQLIYGLKPGNYFSFNTALHYTKGKGYYEEYREDKNLADYGLSAFIIGDSIISSTDLIRRKWMANDFYGIVYSAKYHRDNIEVLAGGGMNLYRGDHFGNIVWMRNAGFSESNHRWYLNNSRKGEISIYGKINYAITGRTSLFGDLQYRNVLYRMSGIDDDLKNISQKHQFGFLNPKAGIFFSVTPSQDAYLSFSVANREPTRTDFKEASGDTNSTPEAETLYDTEIGYKITEPAYSLSVNFYGMVYKDQLVPTGELSDVGYSIMTNVDNSYRLGMEFIAGIKPLDFLSWNFNVTISRNKIRNFTEHYIEYNTTDWSSENVSKKLGEVDLAYSPSVTGTSDLSFKIIRNINLHLISKYVGEQFIDNTMDRERTIDPYFVNNVRIDFIPHVRNTKEIEFQFIVNNIFNEVYESNGYGGNWYEDGIEKSWSYYFPQAGRNYMVRFGLKF